MQVNESPFSVKVSGPGVSVDRPISADVAHQIIGLLFPSNATVDAPSSGLLESRVEPKSNTGATAASKGTTPKLFMAQKQPATDLERITCLAYYLSKYREAAQFKTKELTLLNTDAAQPRFSNAAVAARNAVQKRFLALAGGGRKQITPLGDRVVEALPDRVKLKEILDREPNVRRRRVHKAVKGKKS